MDVGEEYVGNVVKDLSNLRRGQILSIEANTSRVFILSSFLVVFLKRFYPI